MIYCDVCRLAAHSLAAARSLQQVKTLDAQPVDVSMRDKASGEWVARFQVRTLLCVVSILE